MTTSAPIDLLLDRFQRRIARANAPEEHLVKDAKPRQRAVKDDDISAKTCRHPGGMRTDHAAADHGDPARSDAGHAADQLAHAISRFSQGGARRLDRQPSRHLAHRRQQREPAMGIRHRLVGDRGAAGCEKPLGLRGVRRQVQIGEEDLVLAKLAPFRRLRFLDLDHHVGGREDLGCRVHDRCAGRTVDIIAGANAEPGALLDDHVVSMRHIFPHRRRRQTNAIFLDLDFPGHTDSHGLAPALEAAVRCQETTLERATLLCELRLAGSDLRRYSAPE